eukprot:TRINITY_DN1158_c0_g2_i1.p1 TRINITY_DN1158_c0_g2~~TRINITY_DN1158_c0_g2_i1.p1  ORF type:complete len:422 (+),score=61.91 TRINITY_DN1158_c0_g2_i1:74-1267(+)
MEERQYKDPTEQFRTEDEIRPSVFGVVAIHVKDARKLEFNKEGRCGQVYVRISVRNISKRTSLVPLAHNSNPNWDQVRHLPVSVVRDAGHPFNWLRVDVYRLETPAQSLHQLLGSISFHLHDIVKTTSATGWFDLYSREKFAGEISLTICFRYGLFGYGYSPQLKDSASSVEDNLEYSLFPRVEPHFGERPMENERMTVVPKAVPHPVYIPFDDPVIFSYGKEIESLLDRVRERSENQYPELRKRLSRLEQMKNEYCHLPHRQQRLAFLNKLILKNANRDEVRTDAPTADSVDASNPQGYVQFFKPLHAFRNAPPQRPAHTHRPNSKPHSSRKHSATTRPASSNSSLPPTTTTTSSSSSSSSSSSPSPQPQGGAGRRRSPSPNRDDEKHTEPLLIYR